ncbi:Fringe glycosyltransferase [Eumeta japonica]|uniref:Fringe glycosyltransferase n=1 Tax=Eumeta variegata TaxID=151549 RepID=A0A4C1ZRW6_EUMVA|nr:Fringe glycosyltransferase [Eumeta japonica]
MGGRRLIKAAIVALTLAYCGLLAYHQAKIYNSLENPPRIQDSDVTELEIAPASTTDKLRERENTTLDDIFISVKTTKNYEDTRLPVILKTWFQLAKKQTWFFTDVDNPLHQNLTNGHMVNTNCSDSHQRKHLCCKMSVEFDHFLDTDKKLLYLAVRTTYVPMVIPINETIASVVMDHRRSRWAA